MGYRLYSSGHHVVRLLEHMTDHICFPHPAASFFHLLMRSNKAGKWSPHHIVANVKMDTEVIFREHPLGCNNLSYKVALPFEKVVENISDLLRRILALHILQVLAIVSISQ